MKVIQWVLGVAACISVVIILLITSFELAMYLDFNVYQREYEKYDVLSDLHMEMDDTMYVTREMMAYLRGDREELSVVTQVDGKEQDFFNEQDRIHMKDVQGLFLGGLYLRTGSIIVLLLSIAGLILFKTDWKRVLSRSYWVTLGILAAAIAAIGAAVARDFNAFFTKFHEVFFTNDLWIFDPAEDYMIRMLPEGLFYDMVLRIGGFFIPGLVIFFVVSVLVGKNRGKHISTATE